MKAIPRTQSPGHDSIPPLAAESHEAGMKTEIAEKGETENEEEKIFL